MPEAPFELALEVGGQHIFPHGLTDFLHRPEATSVQLFCSPYPLKIYVFLTQDVISVTLLLSWDAE